MTIINLTTPMSDDKERQRQSAAVIDAIERYTEERMNDEYGRIHTDGSRSGGQPVLLPCPFCGGQCADLMIDQGGKWAHYSASCLEVHTGYNISDDAPWRDEAIAAWNTRQPTQSDALRVTDEMVEAADIAWHAHMWTVGTSAKPPKNYNPSNAMKAALEAALQEQSK